MSFMAPPAPPPASTLGRNTAVSTPGSTYTTGMGFPNGSDDMKNFFMEMARRKWAASRPVAPQRRQPWLDGAREVIAAPPLQQQAQERPGPPVGGAPEDPMNAPFPMRLATGQVGVMPHYVADLQHMTIAQRLAYAQANPGGYQGV